MIYAVIFAFIFGASLGFVAGAGWRAMFSGPFPIQHTDAGETGYPGTGTEFEAWATPTNEGTD